MYTRLFNFKPWLNPLALSVFRNKVKKNVSNGCGFKNIIILYLTCFIFSCTASCPCSPPPCSVRLPGACCLKQCKSCCQPACPPLCHTIFLPRSSHTNEGYFLIHGRPDLKTIVASSFDAGYMYEQSFFNEDIATCLVGAPTLSFKGSQVTDRTSNDFIADQFGLSPLFEGTAHFAPHIANHSLHLQGIWYAWGDCHRAPGLFLRGRMTITHQTHSLFNTCDSFITTRDGTPFPPGYMAETSISPLGGLQQALSGIFSFGDMTSPWRAGRFEVGSLSDTNVAGITCDIGYSALHDVIQDFSLFLRYRAPVGTQINGQQKHAHAFFAPIIGDGKHQQFGAGGSFSGEIWSDDVGRSVVIHAQAYGVHPFTNNQVRSFDLLNRGCLSRYLLLKTFDKNTLDPLSELIPAINITTLPVKVRLPALGELAIELMFRSTHATFTIGYNLYGQKAEKLTLRCEEFGNPAVAYGLKGCTGVDYFAYDVTAGNVTAPSTPFAIPLNATADTTTTSTCSVIDTNGGISTLTSTGVGIAWNNVFNGNGLAANSITAGTPVSDLTVAFTSSPEPVTLSLADIDLCSGSAPHQIVHKGILAVLYTWDYCDNHQPYISGGFTAEGSGRECALKQWGLWIKAGTTF